ncbi:hypothetical protein XAB3213_270035 [Xanthomonas citri pv. bilvae]|nr:hypothetical protein XAB3213_270035 [Xanthomonas citri pv. bilvae]
MLMHGASAGGVERGGYRQRWSPRNGIRCLRGRGGGRRIDYTNRPPLPQSGFFRAGSCKKCDGRLKAGVFLLPSGEGPRRGGGGAAASRMLAGRTLTPTRLPQKRALGS